MLAHVEIAADIPTNVPRYYSGYLVAARAVRAEADGDRARAVRLLAPWIDPARKFDLQDRFMWLPDLVRLALAVADPATAWDAARAARLDADGPSALPVQEAAALCCEGQCADDTGVLLRAAEMYRAHDWTLGAALAVEEAAVRLAQGGDVAAARAALNDAVRGYAALGASWDLRRADARLRVHGVRRGPRSLHRRATAGWEALTPTELRIVELVSRGVSNPDIAAELFLSRRTVQTHVSHILSKLNLRSRVEIMRESAAREAAAK